MKNSQKIARDMKLGRLAASIFAAVALLFSSHAAAQDSYNTRMRSVSEKFSTDEDLQSALNGFKAVHADFPARPRPILNVARLYELIEDWGAAAEWYGRYLALGDHSPVLKANINQRREQLAQLVEVDSDPVQKRERRFQTALLNGRNSYAEGDLAGALREAEYAGVLLPDRPESYVLAAMALIGDGDCDQAGRFVAAGFERAVTEIDRQALEVARNSCTRRKNYIADSAEAKRLFDANRYADAAGIYAKLAARDVADYDSAIAGAAAYSLAGRPNDARKLLEAVASGTNAQAAALAKSMLKDIAPSVASAGGSDGPLKAQNMYSEGVRLYNAGQAEQAEQHLSKAIAAAGIRPDYSKYFWVRALARQKSGNEIGMVNDIAVATLLNPSDAAPYMTLYKHYRKKEDNRRAAKSMRDFLARSESGNKARQKAYFNLGIAHHSLRQYSSAIENLSRALKTSGDENKAEMLWWKGHAQAMDKQFAEAEKTLAAAVAQGGGKKIQDDYLEVRSKTLAYLSTGTNISAYSFRMFPQINTDWVKENWNKGLHILDVTHGANGWVVLMGKDSRLGQQTFFTGTSYPKQIINQKWQEGFDIYRAAYGKGQWVVVMGKTPYGQQSWTSRANFVSTDVQTQYDQGSFITDMDFANGSWFTVYSKNSGYNSQTVITSAQFPSAKIEEYSRSGKSITNIAYGQGKWVIVISSGPNIDHTIVLRNEQLRGKGLNGLRNAISNRSGKGYALVGIKQVVTDP